MDLAWPGEASTNFDREKAKCFEHLFLTTHDGRPGVMARKARGQRRRRADLTLDQSMMQQSRLLETDCEIILLIQRRGPTQYLANNNLSGDNTTVHSSQM